MLRNATPHASFGHAGSCVAHHVLAGGRIVGAHQHSRRTAWLWVATKLYVSTMTEHSDGTPSVLVVEDDRDLLSVLQRILGGEGFNVRSAQDGEAGLLEALDHSPDLVILDIGLPRKNGVEVARELRARGFRAPMLMLTARTSVSDKVSGLDAGADDYLPKPFEFAELLARVKALLRRSSLTAESAVMRVRDLALDPISRRVERGGKEIELTQKEYALLEYLMRNMGRTVSRQMISEHVWRQQVDPLTNVVDVYINYLRKKLEEDREHPLIHTVRGSGYVLRDDTATAARQE